jgi:YVTN family beta-propeller protein
MGKLRIAFASVLLVVILALIAVNALLATPSAPSVTSTINVGEDTTGRLLCPNCVAYDSGKEEIYVTNYGAVSVISDNSHSVIATIPVGWSPSGVAYDSGRGEIYVTNFYDNTTSVISDSSHSVVATVSVGGHPLGLAYDSGKGEIYVANGNDNTVSVISSPPTLGYIFFALVGAAIVDGLVILFLVLKRNSNQKLKTTQQAVP